MLHPDVTHHLVPSYALTPAHMTSLLSAAQLVKPEWLSELLARSILDPQESTRALEHTFVLPPESKFHPGFATALPPTIKTFKTWEPNEARLNMLKGYRFVFVGEKGLEIPAEYRDLVKRGGAEYEAFTLSAGVGFQKDSMRNMVRFRTLRATLSAAYCSYLLQFDFTMHLLDSRASRMSPNQALLTLHVDYIGGLHANYRKWYFAAQLDPDDAVGHTQNPGLQRLCSKRGCNHSEKSLAIALERWRQAMNNMSQYDCMRQIALYLLCWRESVQVRFVRACLCFILKCADKYYRSPKCQNSVDPVSEGLYLCAVIKPLYRFVRDQAMSPLMESLCGENVIMIASLVMMM
jgi:hypothetical protein